MATQLLDSARSFFTPEIIQKVGALIGENITNTQKALESTFPSVFAGVLHYASSSADGVDRLIHLLDGGNFGHFLGDTTTVLSGGDASQQLMSSGQTLLETIFGNKVHTLTDLIATNSGISNTGASALLKIVTPLLLGLLNRERTSQRLQPAGLANLLVSNREWIARLAPPGLAGILGLANFGNLGSGLAEPAIPSVAAVASPVTYRATVDDDEVSSLGTWLIPLLIAGLLIPWVIFSRGCGTAPSPSATAQETPSSHHTTSAMQPQPVTPHPPAGTTFGTASAATVHTEATSTPALASSDANIVTLPSGDRVSLDETSMNYKLTKFLADPSDTEVPRTFIFVQPTFVLGIAQLTSELEQAVNDLATILKAYPTVEGQLGSHTDVIGDPAANKRLSQARADAVKDYLTKRGIDANRLSATGYGQEQPRASNETAEGRAENRRLELVIVKK